VSRARSFEYDLSALSTPSGNYTILAIDHGESLRRSLRLGSGPAADHRVFEIKRSVVDLLSNQCSAVLLDLDLASHLGDDWHLPESVGLVIGLDAPHYDDVVCPPAVPPSDEVLDRAEAAGANAIKYLFYYDPDRPGAKSRREAMEVIAERCRSRRLPLLVEPLPLADSRDGSSLRTWPVVKVATHAAEVGASLVKLPIASETSTDSDLLQVCARITDALDGVPWVILSSGIPYAEFLNSLQTALRGGASGFAAGRSIWDQLVTNPGSKSVAADAVARLSTAVMLTERSARTGG
jgi:tagatose-1,6-bisphosphate aldolase